MPYLSNWTLWWWNLPMCILPRKAPCSLDKCRDSPQMLMLAPSMLILMEAYMQPHPCEQSLVPIPEVLFSVMTDSLHYSLITPEEWVIRWDFPPSLYLQAQERRDIGTPGYIHYPLHHHDLWWGLWSVVSSQGPEDSIWNLFGSGECQGLRRPESRESAR